MHVRWLAKEKLMSNKTALELHKKLNDQGISTPMYMNLEDLYETYKNMLLEPYIHSNMNICEDVDNE